MALNSDEIISGKLCFGHFKVAKATTEIIAVGFILSR